MIVTQAEYVNAKEIMEKLQRLPREAQKTIMDTLNGAVIISDMYRDANAGSQREARPGGGANWGGAVDSSGRR